MATAHARGGPASLSAKQPFKSTARIYLDHGWLPMPLPPRKKSKPPEGFTGWDNDPRKVNLKQVDSWLSGVQPTANIALRSSAAHIGIDVDAYKSEEARATWAKIEEDLAEFGGLPDTWISSAQHDMSSGIRHYRLAEEHHSLKWPGTIGDAVQFIHIGHRYAVLPPSVHPEQDEHGNTRHYRWYAPGEYPSGFGALDVIPRFDELPVLPDEVVQYFTKGEYAKHLPEKDLGGVAESKKKVAAWIAERGGEPCAAMVKAAEDTTDEFEGAAAHDTGSGGFYRMVCLSAEGHPGLAEAVRLLKAFFIAEVTKEQRDGTSRGMAEAENEWLRFRDGGVKKVMYRIDAGDFIGSACTCTGFTPEGRPKERLDVDNYHISEALAICYDAMRARAETNWLGLYHSNGELRELTAYGIRPVTVASLRPAVARRVDWIQWKGGEEPRPVPKNPPKELLASMLEDSTMSDELPEIRGVVHTPYYALVDGRPVLLKDNGYHRDAKVFMQMDERLEREMVGHMREDPPYSWVEKAKKLIGDVFRDFPFVSRADKAAAYAALILPFVRELIAGPTPLHLVDAPQEGTGKGLLTDVIGLIACGGLTEGEGFHKVAVTDDRNRNVELAKEITTRLAQFPRVLLLDNVNHKLDSGPIASALTSEMYQARVFGTNDKMVQMVNRALWLVTSNNLKASGEIRRRIVWCRMNARVENPGERSGFKHPELVKYVRENRPALVWAALTLVANWVAEGMPGSTIKMGSYEAWVKTVPGILECAGIEGLLENRAAFNEAAADDAVTLDGLVEEWFATFNRERVSVDQLLSLSAADELISIDARGRVKLLSGLLHRSRERVIGGHMIKWTNTANKSRFHLEDPAAVSVGVKRSRRRRKLGVES